MVVNLIKGQGISLDKTSPGLNKIHIGLGWDVDVVNTINDFDIDASVFLLGHNEKIITDEHFIFYNNLTSPDCNKCVKHFGDNRTGAGEGDDEIIEVNLQQVPANINRIVVGVSIHDFEKRQQNFGQVDNAFVRIVDSTSESEITRYDLTEDFSVETALVVAELYRKNNEWFINAIGKGYQGGLQKLLEIYY